MNFNKKTIKEINHILKARRLEDDYRNIIATLVGDDRKGVQKLCERELKYLDQLEEEKKMCEKMFSFEKELNFKGYNYIAGIDEAGRGPLAGPVVVASVILGELEPDVLYQDSKIISQNKRENLYDYIVNNSISYSISVIDCKRIDEVNILNATLEGMRECVVNLKKQPEYVLVDGNMKIPNIKVNQNNYIGGDAKVRVISAASILAKVYRDRIMTEFDKKYPLYKFAKHKGYGTQEHIALIQKYGPCEIHRQSFLSNIL
ncbi:MAG: ribonuclease HII [Clostridia bacterium]